MAARLHVVDAGAVARLVKRLIVVDAGGVSRALKRLFVVDAGGVARLVFQATVISLIDPTNVSATSVSPANATAAFRLTSAGEIQQGINGVFTTLARWCTPTGAEADYDVQLDVTAGALTSGTTGSRLALSATRTWTRDRTTLGVSSCTLTATIYRTLDSAVMASCTVQLDAEKV